MGGGGVECENTMQSSCIVVDQWTRKTIFSSRGLECYMNCLLAILVVVECWTYVCWAPCLAQNTILLLKSN